MTDQERVIVATDQPITAEPASPAYREPTPPPPPAHTAPMSWKDFMLKVLNGLAMGVVVSLVPGALLGELSKALLPMFPFFQYVIDATTMAQRLLPAAIGIGVAMQFGFTPIQTASLALATVVGSGVASHLPPEAIATLPEKAQAAAKGAFVFNGTGDVINAGITAGVGAAIVRMLGNRLKAYTILLVPTLVIVVAGLFGLFTLPYIKAITTAIGAGVASVTTLQPVLMGILLAMIFAVIIVSPVSSVAIALAISLAGIGSGAANLGITAAAIGFAVLGRRSNSVGTFFAQLLGSPKIQMANFVKHPRMILPVLAISAVLGALGAIFNLQGTPMSAGFGISGLIGPINALNLAEGGWSVGNIVKVALVFLVIPFALAYAFDLVFKRAGIVKDEDYALDFE